MTQQINKVVPKSPITLIQNPKSGHCHKVSLFMALNAIPFETVEPDMANGEHKSEHFGSLNVFKQVPVITDGDVTLADSNAILVYLIHAYAESDYWLGKDAKEKSLVQRWLSVSAGELARGPAAARLEYVFGATIHEPAVLEVSATLLSNMEAHLANSASSFLVGSHVTAADIAMYSYMAHAPEGGISLSNFPHINNWLKAIENLDNFVPMPASDIAAARV
ncbi:glutathione S-transferase N-terminal domain-containing protein [Alteromonas sp. ALT199]|uniref:glutathione S-transferase family protein n=2 Tax=unclassified Alteromonas TaxID=2614992 RepID=UPI000447D252